MPTGYRTVRFPYGNLRWARWRNLAWLRILFLGSTFLGMSLGTTMVQAMPSSDTLLPSSTVAYVSVAQPKQLEAQLRQTQLGQLAQDPSMQPFVDHLRDHLIGKFGNLEERLGVQLEELYGVAGGELTGALIPRGRQAAAFVLLIDTAGQAEQRQTVLAQIDQRFKQRGASVQAVPAQGVQVIHYQIPPSQPNQAATTASYFVHQDLLCVSDQPEALVAVASYLQGSREPTLAQAIPYQQVMQRCSQEAQSLRPDLRWFIAPFPLADALQTLTPPDPNGSDRLAQLRGQGFDAIQGVGGFVNVAVLPEQDFVHRTAVFAPPLSNAAGAPKYRLAMNMLQLPNRQQLPIQAWTPRRIARYTTINVDLLNAFDHFGSLFDVMVAGYDGAFATAMERFEKDRFGPQINFREEIIACLGTRVCLMTDYVLPITTQSERFLTAIEVQPLQEQTLQVALGKYLEKDGYVEKELEGHPLWEYLPEEEGLAGLSDGGLVPDDQEATEETERLFTRSAVCITGGQLFIASDVDFLKLAFQQAATTEALAESYDLQAVSTTLAKLLPGLRCSWSFFRTDETIRPTYELLRQGRMPESETFFGRLLNELLTSPEEQKNQLLRRQQLDATTLPPFEMARRYFGPAGRAIRSDRDGWFITGVLLHKGKP